MEPKMTMTDGQISAPHPPATGGFWMPRFPAYWAVESAVAERTFARLLWLIVPLQYYVMTHVARGLSSDDLIPAVALSLLSVVVIFILSCIAAWLASIMRPPDPGRDDTLTGRVRMWVVALMIGSAGGYLLLALSLACTYVGVKFGYDLYGDLVTDGLMRLLKAFGYTYQEIGALAPWLGAASNLIYSLVAVLLVTGIAHRALRSRNESPAAVQEPWAISVWLIVAVLMTAASYITTLD
jgi:hypothetical protein